MSPGLLASLRAALDIYSPHPMTRALVLAMMALGAMMLWRGAPTGSASGAIPFLLLVWANQERFLATVESLLARHGWALIGLPLMVFTARLLIAPPAASDDLLRHIASAFWQGGYADMYVHTALPPVSLYPAFDWFVGGLALRIGSVPAMWVMQALACAGFVAIFLLAARRFGDGSPAAGILVLAALVLSLDVMAARLMLARPEIFLSIWALAALLVNGRLGVLAWVAVGLILSSSYWLAAIYFPAAILLPLGWRGRFGVFVLLGAGWVLLWWWLSGGQFIEAMAWTFAQVGRRIDGVLVSENISIVNLMMNPPMLMLALAAIWAANRPAADGRLLLLALYFMLSNQARYGGIVAPLLALHALSGFRGARIPLPRFARFGAVSLASASLSLLAAGIPSLAAQPRFELPAGATVFTSFSDATYSLLFWNPGRIRMAPAFEIGALEPDLQRMVKTDNSGEIDCALLAGKGFSHLVENRLSGPVPDCLVLRATQRGWRLWELQAMPD